MMALHITMVLFTQEWRSAMLYSYHVRSMCIYDRRCSRTGDLARQEATRQSHRRM